MTANAETWSRLILWRPRPEFRMPPSWEERLWIPLGELRPLLQAMSPVRDLSDIWRAVAEPLSRAVVETALSEVAVLKEHSDPFASDFVGRPMELWVEGQALRAALILTGAAGAVERIELTASLRSWLEPPTLEARQSMLAVAEALRRRCGCRAAAL